jgi:hypothetical protein
MIAVHMRRSKAEGREMSLSSPSYLQAPAGRVRFMTPKEALRKARRQFAWSFAHKIAIAAIAIIAFERLAWVGRASDTHAKKRTQRWVLSRVEFSTIVAEANNITQDVSANTGPKIISPSSKIPPTTPEMAAIRAIKDVQNSIIGDPQMFATRDELASALKKRVDARIWAIGTNELAEELVAKPHSKDLEKMVREKEAWIRARSAAAHTLIDAGSVRITAADSNNASESMWKKMFDSSTPYYVIFQMLWYSLLLIGVLSVSYLLLILFSALPFTNLESYWTKRITDILSSAAGVRIAAPLLGSAVLAAAIVAPTMGQTAPGGLSREETTIRQATVYGARTTTNIEGSQTTTNIEGSQTTTNVDARNIHNGLGDQAFKDAVANLTRAMTLRVPQKVGDELRPLIMNTRTDLRGITRQMVDLVTTQEIMASDLAIARAKALEAADAAQKALAKATELDKAQTAMQSSLSESGTKISAVQARQDELGSNLRLQTTQTDERNVWARAFGPTMFEMTPAVIDAMTIRLDPTGDCSRKPPAVVTSPPPPVPQQCLQIAALGEMQRMTDEMYSWEFDDVLLAALKANHVADPKAFINKHLGRLLQLSALRRF